MDSGEFYDGTPWCSTKTDPITMEHLPNEGLWGDCPQDDSCTTAEQGMKAELDWEENHISKCIQSTFNFEVKLTFKSYSLYVSFPIPYFDKKFPPSTVKKVLKF